MEKRRAHYLLTDAQALVAAGRWTVTQTATEGLTELGMTLADAEACIMALASADLDKSMTRQDNHRVWQDVYKPVFQDQDLYVKLQVVEGRVILVSFKAR